MKRTSAMLFIHSGIIVAASFVLQSIQHYRRHFVSHVTLLDNYESDKWHHFCDDIDQVLKGLVSPAPESFHVLHTLISKINESIDGSKHDCSFANCINDLYVLAVSLVKPDYSIEIYTQFDVTKWRLNPRNNGEKVKYMQDCIKGKDEFYHKYNVLELSRMALDIATSASRESQSLTKVQELAKQAEASYYKRLALSMGTDLRGSTSSDACFNFVLAGVQHMDGFFHSLCCVGIHELTRTGLRSSFKPKHILHMVEKFAASDIQGNKSLELYHLAGECLEKKGYKDILLVEQLKEGIFGFTSQRPLVWLWRFSSRQRKELPQAIVKSKDIIWNHTFLDPQKPLVVDIGSGMGVSLLNLAILKSNAEISTDIFSSDGTLAMGWSGYNYAGTELNQAMVNFGSGIISRDTSGKRKGKIHFFNLPAEDFLNQLKQYPGAIALIMISFPSPYRLEAKNAGNTQLPLMDSGLFMVTKKVLQLISNLMSKSDEIGYFLFQTKCEDVAVYVKNECLALGTIECVPCMHPVRDIECMYTEVCKRPKRVDEWLGTNTCAERAEGDAYSCAPFLPRMGQPETDAQCNLDNTVVHRCLFRLKKRKL